MWAWQFSKLQHTAQLHGWTKFISVQDQYSLTQREEEREMFGLLADQGVGSIPWSPLNGGINARPWGDRSTVRSQSNPSIDVYGNPLFLDSDQAPTEVVDPDTKEVLGVVNKVKVVVEVADVDERFAIARTFRTRRVNTSGGQNVGLIGLARVEAAIMPPKYEYVRETLALLT